MDPFPERGRGGGGGGEGEEGWSLADGVKSMAVFSLESP